PDGRERDRLEALHEEARDRHAALVLVLPKWAPGPPEKGQPGWLSRVTLLSLPEVERQCKALGDEKRRDVAVQRSGGLRCEARWGESPVELRIGEEAQL